MNADWLTPAEVASLLKVSVRTVGRWIATGDLPALRVGSVVRVGRQALAEWQRRHETAAGAPAVTDRTLARVTRALNGTPMPLLPAGYEAVFGDDGQLRAARPAAGPARRRT